MAISYSSAVATAKYGAFFRLLGRWKGSIYKLIWIDLLVFIILYSTIALIYHLSPITSPEMLEIHKIIHNFLKYVDSMSNSLPLSFILGFFVTLVVNRWIDQFNYLPIPDGVSLLACAYIQIPKKMDIRKTSMQNADEVAVIRQSVARYMNLATVLCFQTIAPNVRKLYENTQSYITSGLMTEREYEFFGQVDPRYHPFYVPLMWAITILKRARQHGYIKHERQLNALVEEILKFRKSLFTLLNYDRVPIPLVYIQVVNIGVYALFIISLVSSQFKRVLPELPDFSNDTIFIETGNITNTLPTNPLIYVPIFSLLEVAFYIGWLKVAQSLLNPFGDDDEDFDLIPLMERNLSTSLWMVDLQHSKPSNADLIEHEIGRHVSFSTLTDHIFFQQDQQFCASGDPLSDLLRSSAEMDLPNTLNPNFSDDIHMGSAARVFENRENKLANISSSENISGAQQKRKSVINLLGRLRPSSTESAPPIANSHAPTPVIDNLQP